MFVSLSGANVAPYDSWANAATSISVAVAYSSHGDVITIDDGTFLLSATIPVSKGIVITSRNGRGSTIVDGQHLAMSCFTMTHASALVMNLTVRNGGRTSGTIIPSYFGGGFQMTAGLVYGCEIHGCTGWGGGGVYATGGWVSHSIIRDNYAYAGGGASTDLGVAGIFLDNCLIYGNYAQNAGGGIATYQATIVNCTICDNSVGTGTALMTGGGAYGGALRNCIVYFNSATTSNNIYLGTYGASAYYCCSPEGTGNNPLTVNPQFLDRPNYNYRLAITSECSGAGNTSYATGLDAYDLDGNPRIKDGLIDMGCYELQFELYSSSSSSSSTAMADSSSSRSSSPSTANLTSSSSSLSSNSSSSKSLSTLSSSSSSQSSNSSSSSSTSSVSSASSKSSSRSSMSSESTPSTHSSRSSASTSSVSSASSESSKSSSSSVYAGVVFEPAGEAYSYPSLVIDVLNQDELTSSTQAAFGASYSKLFSGISKSRLRGDIGEGEAKWGFRNSSGDGRVSNAIVLGGEKVIIYVSPVGHGVGYIGDPEDGIVFTRTRVRITLYDLLRGVNKSVVFEDFSSPAGDPGRHFLWEVGGADAWSAPMRAATGLSGIFLLRVSDESAAYARADLSGEPLARTGRITSETWLQVSSVDWRDAVGRIELEPSGNVAMVQGVEFRTADISPDTTMTEAQVFDAATVFPPYEPASGLTDEQKTTVLRDNAMSLLSSQGPILPADAPEAPIIGMGIESAPAAELIEIPSARPAVIGTPSPRVASRLFSMSGKPVATNTLDALSEMTRWHDQGDAKFRDPIRLLSFLPDGTGTQDFDGGIGWSLAGASTGGAEFIGGGSFEADILVGDETYELDFEGDFVSSSSSLSSVSSFSSLSSSSKSSP